MSMINIMVILLLLLFTSGCGKTLEYIKVNEPLSSNEIFFMRYKFGIYEPEIWAMDRDGNNQTKITEKIHLLSTFCISPDRKKIALVGTVHFCLNSLRVHE